MTNKPPACTEIGKGSGKKGRNTYQDCALHRLLRIFCLLRIDWDICLLRYDTSSFELARRFEARRFLDQDLANERPIRLLVLEPAQNDDDVVG